MHRIEVCIPLPPDLAEQVATVLRERKGDAVPSIHGEGWSVGARIYGADHIRALGECRGPGLDCVGLLLDVDEQPKVG